MNTGDEIQRIEATPELLTIEWRNGAVAEFSSVWLRDNRREDRDPHSGQRLIDIADLPAHSRIRSANSSSGALIGRVCETNYGRVFDVRSMAQPENLAYSDLGLGLHTDNPYREPVPGFQALHALLASPDGGDSLFADGLALGDHLRAVDPAAFLTLTQTPVPFLYRSKDAELYAERPLIQLSCRGERSHPRATRVTCAAAISRGIASILKPPCCVGELEGG